MNFAAPTAKKLTVEKAVEIIAALPPTMRRDVAAIFERTMFTPHQIAVADAVELVADFFRSFGDQSEAVAKAAAKTGTNEESIYDALGSRRTAINRVHRFRECCKKVTTPIRVVTSNEI